MPPITVQKFGGKSVANAERVLSVARQIIKTYESGNSVVVVLSAQGNTTDRLLEKAREINKSANKRELDMLLCTGEQQSVAIMAMAIHSLGYKAVSLNAVQAGIAATNTHGNALIENINPTRIQTELKQGHIVLVAGFQGVNSNNDLTTLGRGASDTTAVALTAVLNAKVCEIYSDVDGIYTVDPKLSPRAKKLSTIGYDEMLELAFSGVQMLHGRAVEMAKRYKVPIVVRSSMAESTGTWIKENTKVEKLTVSGIAIDRNIARVSVIANQPNAAYQIFSLLAKQQISVDIIMQSSTGSEINFTVNRQDLAAAKDILEKTGIGKIETDETLAKLSVVGAGMATNAGVASAIFEALFENDINVRMVSTSEIKIAVLVDEQYVSRAATAIHDKFDDIFDSEAEEGEAKE